MTLRTTIGRETNVIRSINDKVKQGKYDIKAVVHPEELKGYVVIEGKERDIRELARNVRHAKGIISEEVDVSDIEKFITSQEIEIEAQRDDIVEVVGGPFKGEKGKITRVDKSNSEVTLELLEATVPIPVTVGVESIKILESSEE